MFILFSSLFAIARSDLFEYHLRTYLNFSESQCTNFYRHVCPISIMENDTILYKTTQFYRDIEEDQHAFSLSNPIANDINEGLRSLSNCSYQEGTFRELAERRCESTFDCYNTEFHYFFEVFKSLFTEVPEDLTFFANNSNSSIRNASLTLNVTSSIVERIASRINFNATSLYFTSIRNRLAVMDFLNQNNTASIVGLDAIRRISEEFRADILEKLRRTTWLSDVDSFGLTVLDQFSQFVNDMRIYTDFDKYDTDLTFIRALNKKFTAHYFESVQRETGCQWLDVAIALESGKLLLLQEATDNEIYSLLVRVQNSFEFNAFNFYHSVILLATTFFPLTQNTTDPSFIGSTGRIIAHEIYNMFIDSAYVRDHPYFKQESQCLIDHFTSTCRSFGDVDCNSGRDTFLDDASDLEGLRQAHDQLIRRYSVGQLASLAFPDLPYTLEQIFFYAFASLECDSNEFAYDLRNGTRSSPIIRVNGVLSQMPEFTKAFNCFDGEPMSAPDQSVCYLFGQNAIGNDNTTSSTGNSTRHQRFSSNRMTIGELDALIDEMEKGSE